MPPLMGPKKPAQGNVSTKEARRSETTFSTPQTSLQDTIARGNSEQQDHLSYQESSRSEEAVTKTMILFQRSMEHFLDRACQLIA